MPSVRARADVVLRRESGFTLIEMLTSTLLFALIFLVAAAIFISSLTVQKTVLDTSSATVDAQLAAKSIDRGVRNAVGLQLTGDPGAPALTDPDDTMLVAEVATSAGDPENITYNCQAWYYDASAGKILWRATTLTEISAPTEAALSTWTLLAERVAPISPKPVFVHSAAQVSVSYETTVDDHSPVAIEFSSTSMSGAPKDGSSSACF